MADICSSRDDKAETAGSLGFAGQPGAYSVSSTRPRGDLSQKARCIKTYIQDWPLLLHMCISTNTHMHLYKYTLFPTPNTYRLYNLMVKERNLMILKYYSRQSCTPCWLNWTTACGDLLSKLKHLGNGWDCSEVCSFIPLSWETGKKRMGITK